jgi:hypothetical protein
VFAAIAFNFYYAFATSGDDPTFMACSDIEAIGIYGAAFYTTII